jgi:hypothetical protein
VVVAKTLRRKRRVAVVAYVAATWHKFAPTESANIEVEREEYAVQTLQNQHLDCQQ